jgi:hypothetical protein
LSFLKDTSDEESGNDSVPEMFDNVLEQSGGPQLIDQSDLTQSDEEETPVKPPPKKKLGPKPGGAAKRKIETSESEASPVKKKVN